jgi:hypothetical protein
MAEIKEKIGGFRFVDAGVGTYAINMSLGNNELSSFLMVLPPTGMVIR